MNEPLTQLQSKIEARQARVGIIGLGSVGLPLCLTFSRSGFPVVGFDVDQAKVKTLEAKGCYLAHLGQAAVEELWGTGNFSVTADMGRLAEVDVAIICVPTPLGEHREPDLAYIEAASRSVAKALKPGSLVVLESTTYPGTTRNVVAPILAESGLEAENDYLVAFSPEREDPGREDFHTATIPKLVGGTSSASGEMAHALYSRAVQCANLVSSAEVAESAKLLENIFRAVNIALVNELKVVLDAMDIDVWEVIEAAASKPFGFMKFTPGPGLGGHCIPIDPFYLTWIARKDGFATRFIELAGEINTEMPRHVVRKTLLALNSVKKAANGARLLILGLAYKPDVDVITESPSIKLIELLEELGAEVRFSDPWVQVRPDADPAEARSVSVDLSPDALEAFDAVIVTTNHSNFDYDLIAKHASVVVDTRNALDSRMAGKPNYFKA